MSGGRARPAPLKLLFAGWPRFSSWDILWSHECWRGCGTIAHVKECLGRIELRRWTHNETVHWKWQSFDKVGWKRKWLCVKWKLRGGHRKRGCRMWQFWVQNPWWPWWPTTKPWHGFTMCQLPTTVRIEGRQRHDVSDIIMVDRKVTNGTKYRMYLYGKAKLRMTNKLPE